MHSPRPTSGSLGQINTVLNYKEETRRYFDLQDERRTFEIDLKTSYATDKILLTGRLPDGVTRLTIQTVGDLAIRIGSCRLCCREKSSMKEADLLSLWAAVHYLGRV